MHYICCYAQFRLNLNGRACRKIAEIVSRIVFCQRFTKQKQWNQRNGFVSNRCFSAFNASGKSLVGMMSQVLGLFPVSHDVASFTWKSEKCLHESGNPSHPKINVRTTISCQRGCFRESNYCRKISCGEPPVNMHSRQRAEVCLVMMWDYLPDA